MAVRYSAEFLLYLQNSPLCVKPDNLPPAEEWMGAPPDQIRAQTKSTTERPRANENPLLDQTNRRPVLDRHISRNSANPEDIVFAPPRMTFSSARGNKTFENDKNPKDAETLGRFNFRTRNGESDSDRLRDGRTDNIRRRGDGDQDNEGWSTVKPRKSFGHEGAERFQGRMGAAFRDDRRPVREKDEPDATRDRPVRGFDNLGRDKDVDAEGRPRNPPGRSKLETWHRGDGNEAPAPEKRERVDRLKSWRDREADAADDRGNMRTNDRTHDRTNDRNNDRRWDRDNRNQRVEREPEWMEEPAEEHREAHTQQDFQKWMEQMKKAKGSSSSAAPPARPGANEAVESAIQASKPPVQSAPAVEAGPDKFFMAFGSTPGIEATTPGEHKDAAGKSKQGGKSSRFTSFFAHPQEEVRGRTEPPTPLAGQPLNGTNAAIAAAAAVAAAGHAAPEEERQAFQQLLAKLQKQTMSATPPAPSPFAAPPPGHPEMGKNSAVNSPEPFQQYGGDRRDGPLGRPPSQHVQEIIAPRPQQHSARPEQLLQDLVGHHQRMSSQGSGRPEMGATRNNSNTEFLMNLMRAAPETQRPEPPQAQPPPQQQQQQQQQHLHHQQQQLQQLQQQHMMRMAQSQKQPQPQMPPLNDREPDYARDARGAQRQMRPQPPPGFPSMDEGFRGGPDHDARQNQPTQILQRAPPPPGLEQMPPNWMPGGGQMPPPQQRGPMMAPPGLAGGPNRNMPMPPHMFPPSFPPGGMPPPDGLGGMPPRNLPPPPPGFFPPHGFMPPGLGAFNGPPGPGPDSHVFAGSPFDGRGGMPPPNNPGRGANYGRP